MITYVLVPRRMRQNVKYASRAVHTVYIVLDILLLFLDRLDVLAVA